MTSIPRRPLPSGRARTLGIRRPVSRPQSAEAAEAPAEAPAKGTTEVEDTPKDTPESAAAATDGTPKPSPRPKTRDGGVAKPADHDPAEAAVSEPEHGLSSDSSNLSPRPRRQGVLVGTLLALAVVLAGLAVWFKIEDSKLTEVTRNTALLDVARTAQAKQAAINAVESLFSYDFTDLAKNREVANTVLVTEEVKNKYNSLMDEVERLAPEQKIVVTVKASASAVMNLEDDRARVVLLVDQTATRTDQNQTASDSVPLWVNLQQVAGVWKITDLDLYRPETAALTPNQPSPAVPPAGN